MCALGRDGAGALVLCISIMSLMILKIDDVVAPDDKSEMADLAEELQRRDNDANRVYRRAATLGSLLETPCGDWQKVAPRIAAILHDIDSRAANVDISIDELRACLQAQAGSTSQMERSAVSEARRPR